MSTVLVAGAIPFLLGLPAGVLLAPLAGGLVLGAAGSAGVLTSTDPRWWIIPVELALLAVCRHRRPSRPRLDRATVLGALVVAAPFVLVLRPPSDWDAHSIWFFHGEWFAAGGAPGHAAFANPAHYFSHPEYPPVLSATGGLASRLAGGGLAWRPAQLAMTTLGLSVALVLYVATVQLLVDRGIRRPLAAAASALAGLAVAAEAGVGLTNAEADHLAATSFTAASVLLLTSTTRRGFRVGVLVATVAALTKGESCLAMLLVLGLVAWRRPAADRRLLLVPAVAGVVWLVAAPALLDITTHAAFEGWYSPSHVLHRETLRRGARALESMGAEVLPLLLVALVAVAATVLARRPVPPMWAAIAAAPFVVVLASYAVGQFEIELWLSSSVTRTTLPVNAVLATAAAVLAAPVLDELRPRREPRTAAGG